MANSGWSDGTWGSSFWGGFQDLSFSITGVSGTTAVGTAQGLSTATPTPSGQSATGAVGSVVVSIPVTVEPTGVNATGKMTDGWGDGGYGLDAWGGTTTVELVQEVPVTLAAATSGLGSVTVTGTGNLTLSSPTMTASLGTALAGAGAIVTETGLQGDIGFGDESVVGDANVYPTGLGSTGIIGGNYFVFSTLSITVTGEEATMALNNSGITVIQSQLIIPSSDAMVGHTGDEEVTGDANVTLTGVSVSGNIGNVLIWQKIAPTATTTWNEVAA